MRTFAPLLAVLMLVLSCSTPTLKKTGGSDSRTPEDNDTGPQRDGYAPDGSIDAVQDDDMVRLADDTSPDQTADDSVGLADGLEVTADAADGLSFGAVVLPDVEAVCAGIDDLTGATLLAQQSDGFESTLGYLLWVTPEDQGYENPTPLTVTIGWPEAPKIVCYPEYLSEDGLLTAKPRLAIPGLTLLFETEDGLFSEALEAVAWSITDGTYITHHSVFAGVHYDDLSGTYVIPESLAPSLRWLTFRVGLLGGNTSSGNGNVGAWPESLADRIIHGIFPGGAALAAYPVVE